MQQSKWLLNVTLRKRYCSNQSTAIFLSNANSILIHVLSKIDFDITYKYTNYVWTCFFPIWFIGWLSYILIAPDFMALEQVFSILSLISSCIIWIQRLIRKSMHQQLHKCTSYINLLIFNQLMLILYRGYFSITYMSTSQINK